MKKKILQIDSKWSETRKKHETADPSAAAVADRRRRRRPIFPVEYVNTSYHTTFHQNISINVACVQKKVPEDKIFSEKRFFANRLQMV